MLKRAGLATLLGGLAVVAATIAAGTATGSGSVDFYIFAKVLGRVPGKNAAAVEVSWAYKCLGDKLGEATYEWTLKIVRKQPKPERTTILGKGDTKTGSVRARLRPGEYLLTADPFRCETERGAGYDQPEIGQTFVVPDYCSWAVTSSRGGVQLEQGVAVRLAKPGDAVRAGDVLVTPKRGFAALASRGGEGSAEIGSGSRVTVGEQCGRVGGWRLDLAQGRTTAQVKAGAPKGRYVVATPNATSSGQGARWVVGIGRAGGQPRTTVKVLAGRVTVSGRPGSKPVVVPNGLSTVVAGSAPPSKPARG